MRVFKAVQGNGQTVTLRCPVLRAKAPDYVFETKTPGWQVTNAGTCTVLNEGDFCITMTGTLFGKGAVTVLAVTCLGSYDCYVRHFKLPADDWAKQLPFINGEIEKALGGYLKPYGWR